jgi:hypothetical protein
MVAIADLLVGFRPSVPVQVLIEPVQFIGLDGCGVKEELNRFKTPAISTG